MTIHSRSPKSKIKCSLFPYFWRRSNKNRITLVSPLYSISLLFPAVLIGTFWFFKKSFLVENSQPCLEAWQTSRRRLAVPILNIPVLFLFAHKKRFKFAAKLSPRKRKTRKPSFAAKSKPSGYLSGPPRNSVPFHNFSLTTGWSFKKWIEYVLLCCSSVWN